MSHNVRVWTRDRNKSESWYWKDRMQRIGRIINEENPDILCLQELLFPANTYIPTGYRRVGLSVYHPMYVRKGIKTRKHRFRFRWESCEAYINGKWVFVVNVHLHWNEKIFARCMKKINNAVRYQLSIGNDVVMCGDWNVDQDKLLKYITNPVILVPNYKYTFKNKITGHRGVIDHFATNMAFNYMHVLYSNLPLSDHKPITLTLQ